MKYKVEITRISHAHRTIEVEAEDIYVAKSIAVDQAGDYEFPETATEYVPADDFRSQNGMMQYQVNSATNVCNGRIENGANVQEAFKWLQEELDQIFQGEWIY